ncbi:glycosyl transferase [Spirochaetia bacterium]|nr:glycosyl transferase [Spirochaetia bacterium]
MAVCDKISDTAPVVIFTYNRPEHTKKTIDALSANVLADKTDLYIYSDAPKNESVIEQVKAVREFIKNVKGFKSVTIIEREKNWGLADSIIDGVTNVVNKHEKVIVLEDDDISSQYFLQFMNAGLGYYKNEHKVWGVCGWNYPVNFDDLGDAFFTYFGNCVWATWKDRWQYYEKNIDKLIATFPQKDIHRFNYYGASDQWYQVLDNKQGKINTWAIFWYATVFQNKGLFLYPPKTYIRNIGFDNSGVHCNATTVYDGELCVMDRIPDFSKISIEENFIAEKRIFKFLRKIKGSLLRRVINKMKKYINGSSK